MCAAIPRSREIALIEVTISRFGWRDAALERIREALDMDLVVFQKRWPAGAEDLFRDLYLHRCRRCRVEINAALARLRGDRPEASESEMATVVLAAAVPVWSATPWRIIALEYGARLLRNPELLAGVADIVSRASAELASAIAEASSLDLAWAEGLASELVHRSWHELRAPMKSAPSGRCVTR